MVTPRFHPSVGGIEESITQTVLGLQKRGHEVMVHTARLNEASTSDLWRGIQIRRYNLVKDRGFYVSRFEPTLSGDVIHLHAYAHQTNDWVIREYTGRARIVYSTHHGIRFPKPRWWARLYHSWYNRRTGIPSLQRADAVLVPTRVDFDEFAGRGIDRKAIHLVPSGVDDSAFARHAGWSPPGVHGEFLLFLGRLHEEKGVADLVRAYQHANPGLPLVLAGRDEGALAKVGALPGGVHVITEFDERQKWGMLERCRALVLPSHYEGQGIVVAEAWARQKPVVTTRAGGLAAVVKDEATGLVVDVGDRLALSKALTRIVGDPKLAKRLGEAGHAEAQRSYRWPAIIDRIEEIYRNARR